MLKGQEKLKEEQKEQVLQELLALQHAMGYIIEASLTEKCDLNPKKHSHIFKLSEMANERTYLLFDNA